MLRQSGLTVSSRPTFYTPCAWLAFACIWSSCMLKLPATDNLSSWTSISGHWICCSMVSLGSLCFVGCSSSSCPGQNGLWVLAKSTNLLMAKTTLFTGLKKQGSSKSMFFAVKSIVMQTPSSFKTFLTRWLCSFRLSKTKPQSLWIHFWKQSIVWGWCKRSKFQV